MGRTTAAQTTVETATGTTWRLRIRMDDSPGTLARITIRLADLGCNILGLQVMPVPGGVLDELVVRPAPGLGRAELVEAIAAEGCECAGVTDADVRELVEPATAALAAAGRAVDDPAKLADVLRDVLAADMVTLVPSNEANPARTEGGHRRVFPVGPEGALVARRSWAPFVQLEIARAQAMLGLLAAVRANLAGPSVVTCTDGAMVVLRPGRPADTDAVFALGDLAALGALGALQRTGVDVPGDVAVAGFDDLQFAALSSPALTTSTHPVETIATACATAVLDQRLGRPVTRYSSELVLRATA
ncbi:substrate-binding domain-containing protein [Amycolatopsis magusensis]|nr:substrate-binding domain-containing protein [Amycolatopsis magusensis]MDI5977941.1 substrate-binding domain-containing protein [Amycolatopsis magusensis]